MSANIVAPVLCVTLAAMVGSLSQPENFPVWYSKLNVSPLEPPPMAFTIVWTIIYFLIALAWVNMNMIFTKGEFIISSHIEREKVNYGVIDLSSNYSVFNIIFIFNIILNAAWSVIFFNSNGDSSTINFCAMILLLMIISTAFLLFYTKKSILSSICILFYLVWLIFAFYLNCYLIIYN